MSQRVYDALREQAVSGEKSTFVFLHPQRRALEPVM